MTTTPRPDVATRSHLGRWLRTQTSAIVPDWIAAVRIRPPVRVQGTEAPPPIEKVLRGRAPSRITVLNRSFLSMQGR